MYKKFSIDKQKMFESKLARLNQPQKQGIVIMRINKTWQSRTFRLMDNVLYFFKNAKALRSRGLVSLIDLDIEEQVTPEVSHLNLVLNMADALRSSG